MSRAALLAVDGGGSKVDAVVVARDGALLGTARVGPSDGARAKGELAPVVSAVEAASRSAGADPGRQPVASLGVFCLAGADLPVGRTLDPAPGRTARLDQRDGAPQRHVRRPACRDRPDLGCRCRLRLRHQLLGRRAGRQDVPLPGARLDRRRLGRRFRHRRGGAVARGEVRGRTGAPHGPGVPRGRPLRVPTTPAGDAGDVLRPVGREPGRRAAAARVRCGGRGGCGRDVDRRPSGGRDRRDGGDGHPPAPDDRSSTSTSSWVAGSSAIGSRRSSSGSTTGSGRSHPPPP